jgi:hypothetical protein
MAVCPKPNCNNSSFEASYQSVAGVYGTNMILVQCSLCKTVVGVSDKYEILGQLYNIRDWIKAYAAKAGVPFQPHY